jgi:arylsulfatase A-like enzyme
LVFPFVFLIVATSLWPDWRREGREARTKDLVRAAAPAANQPGALNLVLITIDTWRSDFLSLLNPNAPPTPHLDALADEGILFSQMWSTSPWTLPSMGTIMTGKAPQVLGVRKYIPLPESVTSLAEVAWCQGYRSVAFATNPYLTDWYGFDRGFELFEHAIVLEPLLPAARSILAREATRYANSHYQVNSADWVIPQAIRWLGKEGQGKPFFLWIHLMNPHLPYYWRNLPFEKGTVESYRGQLPDKKEVPTEGYFAGEVFRSGHLIRQGIFVPSQTEREALRVLYASEVRFADFWVGRLFQALQELGLWGRTLVVVLSDHGEEFFEHDGFEHGHSVMPEVCRVPMILRVPGGPTGKTVAEPLSILHVFPTLCDLLRLPTPTGLPGASLCPLERPEIAPAIAAEPGPLILGNLLYGPQQEGILAWPWFRVSTEGHQEGTWFDLAADPGATQPLPPPAQARAILATADSLREVWRLERSQILQAEPLEERKVPAELKRQLRTLGY